MPAIRDSYSRQMKQMRDVGGMERTHPKQDGVQPWVKQEESDVGTCWTKDRNTALKL